jgi:hypothetical protein
MKGAVITVSGSSWKCQSNGVRVSGLASVIP